MQMRDLIGQIPGTFGSGQGAFKSSSGNLIKLSDLGWQDTATGEVLAPNSQGQQRITYANPIDYMGKKGYLQPDGSVSFENGSRLASPAEQQASREQQAMTLASEDAQFKRQKQQAELESLLLKNKNMREGKSESGEQKRVDWKYDPGSDTWVKPPDENNPQGITTQPQSKLNAAKSLDYVANELGGVIKDTPQGGFMGVKGMIGRVTDSQKAKRFDNLREQLSTELRTIFRIPGEGALSDKEQAQYGMQLPDVTKDAAMNESIIKDLKNRVSLRLGQQTQSQPQTGSKPDLAALMKEAEDAIARGADRNAVMQRLMQQTGGR